MHKSTEPYTEHCEVHRVNYTPGSRCSRCIIDEHEAKRREAKVNPAYYKKDGQECIDAMPAHMRAWFNAHIARLHVAPAPPADVLMMLGFCLGSAFAYRWRKGDKPGQSPELEESKAQWFDAMALHILNPQNPDPRNLTSTP